MESKPSPRDREPTDRGFEPESFDPDPVAFVEDHAWTFAKTMPHIPHEYVDRGKNGCAEGDWDAFAAYIREHKSTRSSTWWLVGCLRPVDR
jgi:hypothetical protein